MASPLDLARHAGRAGLDSPLPSPSARAGSSKSALSPAASGSGAAPAEAPSGRSMTKSQKQPAADKDGDADARFLAQSLKHLSLTNSLSSNNNLSPASAVASPTACSPRSHPFKRSPSSPSPRSASALRSPYNTPQGGSGGATPSRSRSQTPSLLRKASTSSLRSASAATPSQSMRRMSSASMLSPATAAGRSSLGRMAQHDDFPPAPPKPSVTPASVARDCFKAELEAHHQTGGVTVPTSPTDTVVVLHDACYGHRYSRPRASRAALATIVERPERIKAGVLGLAAAYVRLGERHQDGAFALHPRNDPAALPPVPFRLHKTSRRVPLSAPAVTNVHGTRWMEELRLMCDTAEAKLATTGKELKRPDMAEGKRPGSGGGGGKGDAEARPDFHEGDLYLCAETLEALEGALGGVCDAVDTVFTNSLGKAPASGPTRAFVAIRPPGHHCSAAWPSGFCWINNVHVGIMHAILAHGLTHAAIIDFDLHHGDGSQAIAWEHNKRAAAAPRNAAAAWKRTPLGYFSLHDINSYPCELGDEEKVKNASLCVEGAHGQTIWNVHLQAWQTEADFWALYETRYLVLIDKARKFLRAQTERLRAANQGARAAIFISAGFDASEWEGQGMQRHKVNVPTEFYARITQDLVRVAAEEETGAGGRVISVLEGGYSDRSLCSGIMSHLCGLAAYDAATAAEQQQQQHGDDFRDSGLGSEMHRRLGSGSVSSPGHGGGSESPRTSLGADEREPGKIIGHAGRCYDPEWWSVAELDRLDAAMNAPPPEPPKRPSRTGPAPTYSSPTTASSAKVNMPRMTPGRRSVSSTINGGGGHHNNNPHRVASPLSGRTHSPSRAPSPAPPEVPWTVAAHELSKLLIPTGRATGSCKQEDLNAEATRARQARHQSQTAGQQQQQQSAGVLTSAGQPLLSHGHPHTNPPPPQQQPPERVPTRMALRERKTKPSYIDEDKELDSKPSRRRTVAGSSSVIGGGVRGGRGGGSGGGGGGRRLSTVSTAVSDSTTDLSPTVSRAAGPPPMPPLPRNFGGGDGASMDMSTNGGGGGGGGAAMTAGASRPNTSSGSIRPESSMSVRTAVAPPALTVKKTRGGASAAAATATRKGATASSKGGSRASKQTAPPPPPPPKQPKQAAAGSSAPPQATLMGGMAPLSRSSSGGSKTAMSTSTATTGTTLTTITGSATTTTAAAASAAVAAAAASGAAEKGKGKAPMPPPQPGAGVGEGEAAGGGGANVMDALAGEMKRIKITLVTKEQREARERERIAKLGEAEAQKGKKKATTTTHASQQQQQQQQKKSIDVRQNPPTGRDPSGGGSSISLPAASAPMPSTTVVVTPPTDGGPSFEDGFTDPFSDGPSSSTPTVTIAPPAITHPDWPGTPAVAPAGGSGGGQSQADAQEKHQQTQQRQQQQQSSQAQPHRLPPTDADASVTAAAGPPAAEKTEPSLFPAPPAEANGFTITPAATPMTSPTKQQTPSPMKRADLPAFTATSTLHFSSGGATSPGG